MNFASRPITTPVPLKHWRRLSSAVPPAAGRSALVRGGWRAGLPPEPHLEGDGQSGADLVPARAGSRVRGRARAACALAEENAAVNGLEDRVAVLRADLRDRTALPKAGSFDLCVANPPYFPPHTGRVAEGSRGTARSETACAFDQLCAAAAYLLCSGGRFCLVHRAERTAELMDVLRRHRLEPKVLRFVQKDAQTPPRLVLLSCRRHGGAGLAVHTPLLLQADGGESGELRRIYFKDRG